ncbi:tail fibers protein [Salmonella phage SE4]|uniref:tail fiber assembly protein n=1 Tax=Salmonella phage SE4 TaxID=2575328 RepID=UPI0011D2E16E|nr:tail fiber assembly protein [Salmonella phage SE4]QEG07762.1 tail fibers protein [Salmonella phage SE4]
MKIAKKFGPFTPRLPASESEEHMANVLGVSFLGTPEGRCWYDVVPELNTECQGYSFVTVDESGLVTAVADDPSTLFPNGCTVIAVDGAPDAMLKRVGRWLFDGKKFEVDPSVGIEQARRRKATALEEATQQVSILRDAIDSGKATDEEKRLFDLWRDYRIVVNRADINEGTTMKLPAKPE